MNYAADPLIMSEPQLLLSDSLDYGSSTATPVATITIPIAGSFSTPTLDGSLLDLGVSVITNPLTGVGYTIFAPGEGPSTKTSVASNNFIDPTISTAADDEQHNVYLISTDNIAEQFLTSETIGQEEATLSSLHQPISSMLDIEPRTTDMNLIIPDTRQKKDATLTIDRTNISNSIGNSYTVSLLKTGQKSHANNARSCNSSQVKGDLSNGNINR